MKETPKKNAKRQELIMSIINVVNKDGYENLTVRDICSKAGISIGTFYHYFEEKSDIVRILFKGIDDYFINTVVPSFGDDEIQNIITFVTEYASYCKKSGVSINREISTAPLLNVNKNYLSNQIRQLSVIINEVIKRGQSKGQIFSEYNSEEISRMVLVGMRGYCADWAKNNGNYNIVEATRKHFEIFTKGIRL